MQQSPHEQPQKSCRRHKALVYLAHFLSLGNFLFVALAINRWGVVSQLVLLAFAIAHYVCIFALIREGES